MHDPVDRARRLATAAVELAEVTPSRPSPLERAHLRATIGAAPCDGTMTRVRAWARARRLEPDAVAAWALHEGAVCDCELARRLQDPKDR